MQRIYQESTDKAYSHIWSRVILLHRSYLVRIRCSLTKHDTYSVAVGHTGLLARRPPQVGPFFGPDLTLVVADAVKYAVVNGTF